VDPHLELLTAFFVDVRALYDRKGAAPCRQWDWASDVSASSQGRLNNLLGRLVDNFMVVGLKADTDPLFNLWCRLGRGHWFLVVGHLLCYQFVRIINQLYDLAGDNNTPLLGYFRQHRQDPTFQMAFRGNYLTVQNREQGMIVALGFFGRGAIWVE
jgi:hypothetical protein